MEDRLKDALWEIVTHGTPPRPEHIELIDVGSKVFLEFFEREIIECLVKQGGATCRFFEASYGGGKSHLLGLFNLLASKHQMVTVNIELSRALSLLEWKDIAEHVLLNLEWRVGGQAVRSLPDILSQLTSTRSSTLKHFKFVHSGFANAMELYANGRNQLNPEARDKLKRFLCGERVGAGELRRCGVKGVKNPLSKRNAESVLNTVLSALFAFGFRGTFLLFDEMDQTFNKISQTSKAQVAANLMRRFIDACSNGVIRGAVAIFAVLPDFLPACVRVYPALGDRLVVYRDTFTPGWRFPVLRLDDIAGYDKPETFMEELIRKIVSQVTEEKRDRLSRELSLEGQDVLLRNPGPNFKRPLLKRIASKTLQFI